MSLSGGCQCGAVRYRAAKAPSEPHLCHCRMCQKAAGNYFMPLGGVAHTDFKITRDDHVAITLGSLDRPQDVMPIAHSDAYARMPWFNEIFGLPDEGAKDPTDDGGARYRDIRISNHQHPDHDTAVWPAKDMA